MATNFNNIEKIESYLSGSMDAREREAFELQLEKDETLGHEVNAYRQLFEGFEGLKEEAFRQEVVKWTDAAQAASVSHKTKIVSLNPGRVWRRFAAAAGILLLIGAGLIWWTARQYATIYMVENAYRPPLSGGTMGNQTEEQNKLVQSFESAHQNFQQGNYRQAIQQFNAVIQLLQTNAVNPDSLTRRFYLENAKWTSLLAQFANGRLTDEEFSAALDDFANDPASDYAEKAADLQSNLDSFWRKIGR